MKKFYAILLTITSLILSCSNDDYEKTNFTLDEAITELGKGGDEILYYIGIGIVAFLVLNGFVKNRFRRVGCFLMLRTFKF